MQDIPSVSIVVPNYNGAAYLSETIESVQAQTHSAWELIVVDDGSTDESVALVRACAARDPRIRLLALGRNCGRPSIPRNAGIAAATGDYVAFLDADDLWHPRKLEVQLGHLRRNGTDFVSSDMRDFRDVADIRPLMADNGPAAAPQSIRIDHALLLRKNIIPTSSVLVRREIIDRQRFIEDVRYKAIEDYHCWLRIHRDEIPYSHKLASALVYYRRTRASISRSKLSMLGKNYLLFSEYRVGGAPLGLKRFFYLASYVWLSLLDAGRRALIMRLG